MSNIFYNGSTPLTNYHSENENNKQLFDNFVAFFIRHFVKASLIICVPHLWQTLCRRKSLTEIRIARLSIAVENIVFILQIKSAEGFNRTRRIRESAALYLQTSQKRIWTRRLIKIEDSTLMRQAIWPQFNKVNSVRRASTAGRRWQTRVHEVFVIWTFHKKVIERFYKLIHIHFISLWIKM